VIFDVPTPSPLVHRQAYFLFNAKKYFDTQKKFGILNQQREEIREAELMWKGESCYFRPRNFSSKKTSI